MSRGLQLYASPGRAVAARVVGAGGGWASGAVCRAVPLRYVEGADPVPPAAGWVRVRPSLSGIGGADLALVTGRASGYLAAGLPLPFVPGREVVGLVQEQVRAGGGVVVPAGGRVVVDASVAGRAAAGGVAGGGWSRVMVVPAAALRVVPAGVSDARAVLVDAAVRAVRAVAGARVAAGARVLVVGSGAVGLCTVLALRAFSEAGEVVVVTRHGGRARLAGEFGASVVFEPAGALAGVRRVTRAVRVGGPGGVSFLRGGVEVAVQAAGDAAGLSLALRVTAPGGRVVVAGVPSGRVAVTPVWARELELVGVGGGDGVGGLEAREVLRRAWVLLGDVRLEGLVGAVYPLGRWREALAHAWDAGRLGVVRVAFDPAVSS
ncbi:zinc-binding dehydrogenase [Frankia sp. AgKG'84/4]|uniref:zinc-binding dehydrogenase n=1 Tax=Frankia sp. AgKG'84/4 TaxID=573490 RepID=UPI002029CE05|nr:zinc-binding dehydrogenase [Frankia sp. AgKG'84/4]MCL9793996.1 zinc-binding dehydrogenase [Frankia sp. AgKG'84/4]